MSRVEIEEEGARSAPRVTAADALAIALLVAWVVASRVPFVVPFDFMGKDGPLYISALKLDRSYAVPMPGNLGFVLLGKLAHAVWADPIEAYAAVNIALTAAGAAFVYLLGALALPRALAAAAAFALTCNAIVWWHGDLIASYLVWLAVLPALGWFGARFVIGRRGGDLVAASAVLGLGMVLRQDLLAFGTPLWLGCLALGRASRRGWLVGGLILAVACAAWFWGTAAVLGGADVYLARVRAKHEFDLETFSLARRGLIEGLLRNGSKYGLFLAWSAHLALVPFAAGAWGAMRSIRTGWRAPLLAALWVGPSWYFSFVIHAGTAGLIFPLLPLLYLGAARGVQGLLRGRPAWGPAAAMAALALLGAGQFLMTPLLAETDQRRVIANVTWLRYSGAGLRERYNYNLEDYAIDPSLRSVLRQIRDPQPVPRTPPRNLPHASTPAPRRNDA